MKRLRLAPDKLAGVLLVLALHAAALWGLWSHRLIPLPQDHPAPLFVSFVAPSRIPDTTVSTPAAKRPPPQRRPAAPADILPAETAVAPAPTPVITAPPEPKLAAAPAAPVAPVELGAELALSCPERKAPNYPLLSRRMNETGIALLKVELDPQGRVSAAAIANSSGSSRLDAAALAAVRSWRCKPAQRNGQPVGAVALQPFKFVLQGS